MTTITRLERLEQLRAELAALLTPTERRTYPALEHLLDLIADLRIEGEQQAA